MLLKEGCATGTRVTWNGWRAEQGWVFLLDYRFTLRHWSCSLVASAWCRYSSSFLISQVANVGKVIILLYVYYWAGFNDLTIIFKMNKEASNVHCILVINRFRQEVNLRHYYMSHILDAFICLFWYTLLLTFQVLWWWPSPSFLIYLVSKQWHFYLLWLIIRNQDIFSTLNEQFPTLCLPSDGKQWMCCEKP